MLMSTTPIIYVEVEKNNIAKLKKLKCASQNKSQLYSHCMNVLCTADMKDTHFNTSMEWIFT